MARKAEQEEAPATNESQESVAQKGYVQYIGTSHVRQITEGELSDVGLKGKDLTWDKANNWTIARSDISDDVYERAIVPDMELVLVDGEGQRV